MFSKPGVTLRRSRSCWECSCGRPTASGPALWCGIAAAVLFRPDSAGAVVPLRSRRCPEPRRSSRPGRRCSGAGAGGGRGCSSSGTTITGSGRSSARAFSSRRRARLRHSDPARLDLLIALADVDSSGPRVLLIALRVRVGCTANARSRSRSAPWCRAIPLLRGLVDARRRRGVGTTAALSRDRAVGASRREAVEHVATWHARGRRIAWAAIGSTGGCRRGGVGALDLDRHELYWRGTGLPGLPSLSSGAGSRDTGRCSTTRSPGTSTCSCRAADRSHPLSPCAGPDRRSGPRGVRGRCGRRIRLRPPATRVDDGLSTYICAMAAHSRACAHRDSQDDRRRLPGGRAGAGAGVLRRSAAGRGRCPTRRRGCRFSSRCSSC